MQKQLTLKLLPSEAANEKFIRSIVSSASGIPENQINGYHILRRSIDARSKQVWIQLKILAYINEPIHQIKSFLPVYRSVQRAKHRVIIIGSGPAGLFAALRLIEQGIQPIIIERGKEVRKRRRDLALLNREGIIDTDSNYCFGEGGAGTYSDGKLYTRSHKRGDLTRILGTLHFFGADDSINYDAHPHIGTNKLPGIISSIREQIIDCGGIFHFEKRVIDFDISKDVIRAVKTWDGDLIEADAVILATGHSARDIFYLLHDKKWKLEPKPFALGVRVEHPQQLIDQVQYHCTVRDPYLPPASYSLVQQVEGKGVFSFCMCPGGIIATASTAPGELVVNGWSPSKRNNPFANSGIVVEVSAENAWHFIKNQQRPVLKDPSDPFLFMHVQQMVEKKAFEMGGGKFVAPAQRLNDFINGKLSGNLPVCSYIPGIHSADMKNILPDFIQTRITKAFREFGTKMKGYNTNEAVVVATESRTSSPVRIPRDPQKLNHPQVKNLFPCGEGAGYAGGIMSAAMDGEKIASAVSQSLQRNVHL